MKKVLIAALALFAVCTSLVFVACQGKKETDGKKRVAFIARTQGDTFPAWLVNALKEEAAAKYPDMVITVMDGQSSDEKIASFIENSITNKYDVIVVQPQNTESQRPPLEKVVAAKIPLVTVNLRIPGMEGNSNSVDANAYEQGAQPARAALTQVPQNATVVVLNGPAAHFHSIARRDAWEKEFFAKRPDVKKVGEQFANWNKDEAMRYMEDWVQANDRIDAVISMNDNMATGAVEVIKNNPKYANLLVYGVDGTAEAALLIQEGKMTSTSFQNAYLLAENTLRIVNDILTGKQTGFENMDIECPLITKDNVQFLIDTHKRAGAL
jgi:inositol transport system substrate-binding protein